MPSPKKRTTAKSTRGKNIRRRNGLLKTTIPARSPAMKIARNNQQQSPLLRMPPEIRGKIFGYALGGHLIDVKHDGTRACLHRIQPGGFYTDEGCILDTSKTNGVFEHLFALVKTCRQIYQETAVLPYSLNTFRFISSDRSHRVIKDCFNSWILSLGSAKRNAITSISPSLLYMEKYRVGHASTFRSKVPNLKHIAYVYEGLERDFWRHWYLFSPLTSLTEMMERQRQNDITRLLRQEGEDLIVDFSTSEAKEEAEDE